MMTSSLSRQISVVSQASHQTLSQVFLLVRKVVIIHCASGTSRMHYEPILAVGQAFETAYTAIHEQLAARMCMSMVYKMTSWVSLKTGAIVATSVRINSHSIANLDRL